MQQRPRLLCSIKRQIRMGLLLLDPGATLSVFDEVVTLAQLRRRRRQALRPTLAGDFELADFQRADFDLLRAEPCE